MASFGWNFRVVFLGSRYLFIPEFSLYLILMRCWSMGNHILLSLLPVWNCSFFHLLYIFWFLWWSGSEGQSWQPGSAFPNQTCYAVTLHRIPHISSPTAWPPLSLELFCPCQLKCWNTPSTPSNSQCQQPASAEKGSQSFLLQVLSFCSSKLPVFCISKSLLSMPRSHKCRSLNTKLLQTRKKPFKQINVGTCHLCWWREWLV